MSLISEALRKARQEAAEREAPTQGMETPVVAGYWKRGGRLGAGLVMGAVIAMGAAVVGGGLVWWVLADRSEASVKGESPGAEVVEAHPAQKGADLLVEQPDETIQATAGPVAQNLSNLDVPPAVGDNSESKAETIDSTPDRVEGAPTEVPSPNPPSTLPEGEFVGEAQVGDVTLTLDYLVFRKENPFAQINGRDVRVGAVIEDYVVEAITENSVVLGKSGAKVVIRVQ